MPVPVIRQSDKTVVYYCNAAGRIILAPDSRMRPEQCGLDPANWKRCEATGAREIEKVSLVLSRQIWEEKRQREVTKKIREIGFLQQREASARLRAAQRHSPEDVKVNLQLERDWKRKQDQVLDLIAMEFDPTKRSSALDIELHEQADTTGTIQKRQGIYSESGKGKRTVQVAM